MREQRFNTRLQCITLRWIEHRFGQGKGGNNHDVVGVEIVRGRKTAKSGVCVCYSSSPSLKTTSRPHIHIKHHKGTRYDVLDGDVSQSVQRIHDLRNTLHLALHQVIHTIGIVAHSNRVQSQSQSIWEVTLANESLHLC